MVQPWARETKKTAKTVKVMLKYTFNVDYLPSGGLYLGIEQPGTFDITLNGQAVDSDADCGWWTDRSLRKLAIDPAVLRVGSNCFTMVCDYSERHPGFEILYLLGEFGTAVRKTEVAVTKKPAQLKIGDWGPQGLVFYSGSVNYLCKIQPKLGKGERVFVDVPGFEGAAVRVLVDGQEAGIIAWEPKNVDITDFVGDKRVTLAIEVLGHRRNSHGPLHLNENRPSGIGPAAFRKGEKSFLGAWKWTEGYKLVAMGLTKKPKLVVRKEK